MTLHAALLGFAVATVVFGAPTSAPRAAERRSGLASVAYRAADDRDARLGDDAAAAHLNGHERGEDSAGHETGEHTNGHEAGDHGGASSGRGSSGASASGNSGRGSSGGGHGGGGHGGGSGH